MQEIKRFSLVKPTTQTPFHIDFDWWKNQEKNWRVYLFSYLCPDHQRAFADNPGVNMIDWVDPETAEISSVDGLLHILMNHCATQPNFVTQNTSLVDSVFRLLLANGNTPLSPNQLGEATGRPPETILRTLAGATVYKGIRPIHS
jgi:hypothetical protein